VGMAIIPIHRSRFWAALPMLDRAEGLLPGAWFVHFAKAWAHLETGNTEAALKQADCAERVSGPNSEMRLIIMLTTYKSDAKTRSRTQGRCSGIPPEECDAQ
jgi:hypothetical protein